MITTLLALVVGLAYCWIAWLQYRTRIELGEQRAAMLLNLSKEETLRLGQMAAAICCKASLQGQQGDTLKAGQMNQHQGPSHGNVFEH